MTKVFWENLVETREIKVKISKQDLAEEEKLKLITVVEQTFHLRIIETVLSSLPKEKHKQFIDIFAKKPHDPKLLQVLKKDVADIEQRITKIAEALKKEILANLSS